jgi:hypothetical protein
MTDKKQWYPAEVICLDCGAAFVDGQHYILDGKCLTEEEYKIDNTNR